MVLQHKGSSKAYNELAEIPVYAAARFNGSDALRVTLSTRDHTRNAKVSLTKTLFLGSRVLTSSTTQESDDIFASTRSPSGALTAILREVKEQEGKKRYVEIWDADALKASRDVTEAHGAFYADDFLASLSFSPSETSLLYTAEAKLPSKEDPDPYARFRFVPQFGEGLTNKKKPTIFLFSWESEGTSLSAVSLSQPPPSPILFGQAVFGEDNSTVYATGHELAADGRVLGLKYCFNRQASIWELQLPGKLEPSKDVTIIQCHATRFTGDNSGLCSRSARFLSGQKDASEPSYLVWLSGPAGGAHASCGSLHTLDSGSKTPRTLVERVTEPGEDGFPGLYPDASLPGKPFLKLGGHSFIAFQSTWGSRNTVLLISLENGKVTNLTPSDENLWNYTVLVTDSRNRIVCSRSNSMAPNELVLGTIDESNLSITWRVLHKPKVSSELQQKLSTLRLDILKVPDRHPVETIVIRAKDSPTTLQPTVLIPHGGPHGATNTALTPYVTSLALEGYTIALPNYTGSTGYGETYVNKLIGQCGSLDVEDCVATVKFLIDSGISEAGKLFIQGGSHGGFLTGHLIGQYPEMFSAAVLRNPVISCGEISTSDIIDWYYAEFGLEYGPTTVMTPASYEKLFNASPIRYVDAVRTPVLLQIGDVDQRVAPTQGIGYYHALKARGKVVEVICFEKDSHPLDSVEASRVGFEAMRDWFAAAVQ